LKSFINSDEARKLCRNNGENTFLRDRKLPFNDILKLCLNKQGKTTSFEIRNYELFKKGAENVNYTDEAYLKQRRHLNPEVFKEANKRYLKDFYNNDNVEKEKGYILLAGDGSSIEVPNTKKNREHFGYHKQNSSQNFDRARGQISTLYDLNNNFYLDVTVNKYKYSESTMAKENIEKTLGIIEQDKLLIIFDRNYPSLLFFMFLEKRGIKFLMRLPRGYWEKEINTMKSKDKFITIKHDKTRLKTTKQRNHLDYEEFALKKETKVRITKIILSTGEEEILVSNLDVEEFNTNEIMNLYNKRWGIESSYNTIKNKLKIEAFSGDLPQFIYQDIYAGTLVFNQFQDLKYESQLQLENKKKITKHKYVINENKAIGLFKEQFIKIILIDDDKARTLGYNKLITDMTNYIEAERKNRPSQPRIFDYRTKYRRNLKDSF
jgi:predicted nucleic-acid-binding Zn-ribbon protein